MHYSYTLPRNMVYPALLSLMRTPRLSVVDWTDDPADLNGLVRFAEWRNLVSARVPSHFKRSLHHTALVQGCGTPRCLSTNFTPGLHYDAISHICIYMLKDLELRFTRLVVTGYNYMGSVLQGAVFLCWFLKRHSVQMLLRIILYYNKTDTIPCTSKYWEH